jgi:hypothetical protein
MMSLSALLRFFTAGILQALFFQHLVWANGWLTPSIHVYGLALLPLGRKPWTYLVAGGVMGLLQDFAAATNGLYTATCLAVGFLQPSIGQLLAPREGYELNTEPTAAAQGWTWFSVYTVLMVGAHNLVLFGLEAGRWDLLFRAEAKALTSVLLTLGIVALVHLLFQPRPRTR